MFRRVPQAWAADERCTTRPSRDSTGSRSRVSSAGANVLTTKRTSSPSAVTGWAALKTPALLIRTSSGPAPARTSRAIAATAARSERSARTVSTTPPARPRACAVAASFSALRPWMTSVWPSPANCAAAARPIPSVAPVIRIRFAIARPPPSSACARYGQRTCLSPLRRQPPGQNRGLRTLSTTTAIRVANAPSTVSATEMRTIIG